MEDEQGRKFIIDAHGNKVYVKYNSKGEMYYVDAHGRIHFINPTFERSNKDIDNNFDRLYSNLYKKFMTNDKSLLEKITYMDDEY